jgi:pilus assembly protein Flp/PilA
MGYWIPARRDHTLDWPQIFGAHLSEGVEPMPLIGSIVTWLHRDEEGQGLAEYALILALIAVLAIVALLFLGGRINTVLSTIGNSI